MTILKRNETVAPAGQPTNGLDVTERKVFEAALREAERKYRDIFENASEGIFQTTPDGRFFTANPAMAAILGFDSPDELINARTNISREHYVNPEKRKEFKQLLSENGFVRDFVHEAYRKDGTRIWLSENVRAVPDEKGVVRYYEGTSTDITERKIAKARSAAFANLAQRMSGVRTQLGAARIIAETASDLFGWDALNLDLYDSDTDLVYPMMNVDTIGGKLVDVTPSIPIAKPTARARRVIDHGAELMLRKEPVEFDEDSIPFGDMLRPSAALMTVPIRHLSRIIGLLSVQSYRPRAYDNASVGVLQALADHCGEALSRIRAEESLYESEERYRDLVENSRELICTHDLKGLVLSANRAAADALGYQLNDFVGKRGVPDILAPEVRHQFDEYMARVLRDGETTGTMLVQTSSGERRVWEFYNSLRTKGVSMPIVRGMARDITDRKRAEEALRQSERDYRGLFNQAHDAIIVLCAETEIVLDVNERACEMYGFSRAEFIGMSLESISKYPAEGKVKLAETLEKGQCLNFEAVQYRQDGTELSLEINASMVLYNGQMAVLSINRDTTERKRSDEALKLFRSLLDQSSDAIEVIDPETMQFLDCNESACRCLGYSREEFLRLTVFDIDPNVNPTLMTQLDKEIERTGFATLESLHRRKDGSTFPVEINVTIVQLERNYRLAVVRDITERKRAEFDAHRQSEILEKIVDHIPVMINFTGSDGRIKLVNQEWQTTLGWSLEDVVREGADVFTACYPDPAYRADVLKFVSTCSGEWADFKTRTRDGRVIDTCWARVLLSDGTTIGIGRDITEQKQAERAVRDAEQKYRELFENARDALYVHDLNGRYTSVNRAAESLTGYDREEILGKDFVGFVARKHVSRVRKNLCKKLEEESETTYEVEIITKDGRRIPVEVSSHLIYNNGIPVGVQGAVRDISDRKKAQESLQSFSRRLLAAQEAERQRIARTLHDEIGQVLTAVKINLQTTHGSLDSIDSADRITESIDIIDEALVRVRDLSIDLRPPHLDDFGLATALRWYVDTYSQRTGTKAKFSEELNGSSRRLPQEIETACFRIAQEALTNITRHAAASSVSLKLKQRREQLRLTITDNGIGFDVLAVTGRITAETLGLRGMKERTQAVGGSLEINSTLGKGTEVRALFPIQGARK